MHPDTDAPQRAVAAEPAIEARGLLRRYGTLEAVRGIDLVVARGECFGILGPNGAGKTSTIRMITCRLPPNGGELRVLGRDVRREAAAIKARIGVVAQENNLDEALTVRENLVVFAGFFGIPAAEAARRADALLAFFELENRRDAFPRQLSGGMKRRLAMARALINEPELVVLDEPTTGLDPEARLIVWQRLGALRRRGITLLLTTHYMEEAQRLCDRVAIMDRGVIRAVGSPAELVGRVAGPRVLELVGWEGDLPSAIADLRPDGVRLRSVRQVGGMVYVYTDDPDGVLAALRARGVRPQEVRSRPSSLEDVYLALVDRPVQGGEAR